jgi:hypothetical protein
LVYKLGYTLIDGWVALSILLYLLIGAFWLPVVFMQKHMRDLAVQAASAGTGLPGQYFRLFWLWFIFDFPAFAAALGIFWLMIAKPEIGIPRMLGFTNLATTAPSIEPPGSHDGHRLKLSCAAALFSLRRCVIRLAR